MSRVRAFFVREAEECLAEVRAGLDATPPVRSSVYGGVRRFRGSAQLARYDRLAAAARVLERRLRPEPVGEAWSRALADEVTVALDRWHAALAAVRAGRGEEDSLTKQGIDGTEEVAEMEDTAGHEGDGEARAAATAEPTADPAAERAGETMEGPVEGEGEAVVALESLEYDRQAALERALALREPLENAIVAEEPAGPILEELFDLIRIGAE